MVVSYPVVCRFAIDRLVSSHPASSPFVRVSYLLQRPNCSSETLPWISGNALEPGFVRLPPRNWARLITSSLSPMPLISRGRLLRHTCRAGTLVMQQESAFLLHSCCTARVFYRHLVQYVEAPVPGPGIELFRAEILHVKVGLYPFRFFGRRRVGFRSKARIVLCARFGARLLLAPTCFELLWDLVLRLNFAEKISVGHSLS